ncbi:hypothetical protein M3Y98_00471800 [Aphelenchoides besseyi]|nr:hypothetical protein M3Y98_00471800 [Aphelenchoides besseyi]KAI6207579.1 hypothetical protein M3Y96_00023900 [Aphelenchoides besseyi]
MRARFDCVPAWAWLTFIIFMECSCLSGWLCREYFVFDYNCFLAQVTVVEEHQPDAQQIHLYVDAPDLNEQNLTRTRKETTQIQETFEEPSIRRSPEHRPRLRKKKRPTRGQKVVRTVESVVRIEPLISLYADGKEQTSFKTKTTFNKFHKQPRPLQPSTSGLRRRRKKKRPADGLARRQAAKRTQQSANLEVTSNTAILPTEETAKPNVLNEIMTTIAASLTTETPQEEVTRTPAQLEQLNLESRWRKHGIGGPTSIAVSTSNGQRFTEQLQRFAQNTTCLGRSLLNLYAIAQIIAAFPFLIGIRLRARCLFSPFLVLSAIFLVVLFVYAATITVLSLVLFFLVDEMRAETLFDWMLFAAVLDGVFVLATLLFTVTLQSCDSLVAYGQTQSRTVEVPESILVSEDAQGTNKKYRSKSLIYAQLAVDDFFNGRS